MAIFYNYIKGCGKDATGPKKTLDASITKTTDTEVWTWIKWADTVTYTTIGTSADLAYAENNPTIYLNSGNVFSTNFSLGKIITSNSKGQKIDASFMFTQGLTVQMDSNDVVKTYNIGSNPALVAYKDMWFAKANSCMFTNMDTLTNTEQSRLGQIYANTDAFHIIGRNLPLKITASLLTIDPNTTIKTHLHVGSADYKWPTDYPDGVIKADSRCEALYFNATSDRRAKTNITPTEFSALATVNALPVYTFNYTTQPDNTTIGLIAQEAAEHNLDGFSMVDNLNASGENNDFMQMKESKLVYVLWKAVQELSAEVESLKAQLNNK